MLYWILRVILPPFLHIFFRVTVTGRDNVPRHGGAILAFNHLSAYDWVFGPLTCGFRKVTYVAKAEYFDSWKTRWFFSSTGQIPVRREAGGAADGALAAARDVVEHGGVFGIFPEGTRSPDGRLYRGKTGAARLALETGVPLVPCAVVGADRVLPPGRRVPNFGEHVAVHYGEPIDVSPYRVWTDRAAAARALTDHLMREIGRLSGQEYLDVYASDAKAAIAAGVDPRRLDESAA